MRKQSDQAVEALTAKGLYVQELKALQHHADELVKACIALSRAVYTTNIEAEKDRRSTVEKDVHAQLQEQVQLQRAYEAGTEQRLAQDDISKQALVEERKALIQAVEYQIAYVVVGAEATAGKLQI